MEESDPAQELSDPGSAPEEADDKSQWMGEFVATADPLIEAVLRRHFFVSMAPEDGSKTNMDAIEVASDLRARLISRFASKWPNNGFASIDNLEAYIRSAAHNAFRDYLRKKHPNRLRLSNRIRFLLRNTEGLAIWGSDDGEMLCGTSLLRDRASTSRGANTKPVVETLRDIFEGIGEKDGPSLKTLLFAAFESHKEPIAFGVLVSAIAEAIQTVEPREESDLRILDEVPSKAGKDVQQQFEGRESLEFLWQKILELSVRHRTAILLNLRTEEGDNALPLFPALRIASVTEIADALEMSPEELAGLWPDLPIDDNSIAQRLGLSRQQVINLRASARSFLRRHLEMR